MSIDLQEFLQTVSKDEAQNLYVRVYEQALRVTQPRIAGTFTSGANLYTLNRKQKEALRHVEITLDTQWVVDCVDAMTMLERAVSLHEFDSVAFIKIVEGDTTLVYVKNSSATPYDTGIYVDLAYVRRRISRAPQWMNEVFSLSIGRFQRTAALTFTTRKCRHQMKAL